VEENESVQESPEAIDDLDEAFDAALAGLSDANAKVTEVLETMDNPEAVSTGVEVDEDGNIVDAEAAGDEAAESETSQSEPSDS
jgi:hypothetical protein